MDTEIGAEYFYNSQLDRRKCLDLCGACLILHHQMYSISCTYSVFILFHLLYCFLVILQHAFVPHTVHNILYEAQVSNGHDNWMQMLFDGTSVPDPGHGQKSTLYL